jgi:hypothetical protein
VADLPGWKLRWHCTKVCGRCGEVKRLSDFHRLPSAMTGHDVKFFASGNQVSLKWIDRNSDVPAFVTVVKDQMKADHATSAAPAASDSPDIADQIRKLAQLRDEVWSRRRVRDEEGGAAREAVVRRAALDSRRSCSLNP